MNTREKLRRRIIELIHKCEYKIAINKEPKIVTVTNIKTMGFDDYSLSIRRNKDEQVRHPDLTIARVMQALGTGVSISLHGNNSLTIWLDAGCNGHVNWQLTKESMEDVHLFSTDRSGDYIITDETVEKLYNLLKTKS